MVYPFPGVLPVTAPVTAPDTETLRPYTFDDPMLREALAVLRCPICLEIRYKGVTLPECGHRFCGECIRHCHCSLCPVCRHPFEEEDTSYETVDAVQHEEERHLLLHIASFECGWCHASVRLKHASEHLSSCPERLVRCRCSKMMRLREHEEHANSAACRPSEPCVFGCSEATGIFFNCGESHETLRECHEHLLLFCRHGKSGDF